MKYSFNERFTFLVDDMPGENYTQKLQTIAEATDINVSLLRKYYLAENDVDYVDDAKTKTVNKETGEPEEKDANQNRVKKPLRNLTKLADYFNCTPEYLLGESDIYDREIATFLANHGEFGLTEDMLIGLKEINQLDNKKVYHDALSALLKDYHNRNEPYQLLYLIGQYLTPLSNKVEATLSPDIINNLINASSSIRDTYDIVQTELLKNIVFKIIDETPTLIAIQKELETTRAFLDSIQNPAIGYYVSIQGNTNEDMELAKNGVSVSSKTSNKPIKK